jgi:hypothetical protein
MILNILIKKYIFPLIILICLKENVFSQGQKFINLPKYDRQKIHFGFLLGYNKMDFTLKPVQNHVRADSILTIEPIAQSGFNIGIISSLRLAEYWDVRFVPDLAFGLREIEYNILAYDTLPTRVIKKVESTYINFPITFKYKSHRYNNFRAYIVGGTRCSLDLASMVGKKDNEEKYIKLDKWNIGLDIGTGVDFYLVYFKFSIELKMSYGLNNLLRKDDNIYSQTVDKLHSKIFLLSFNFE